MGMNAMMAVITPQPYAHEQRANLGQILASVFYGWLKADCVTTDPKGDVEFDQPDRVLYIDLQFERFWAAEYARGSFQFIYTLGTFLHRATGGRVLYWSDACDSVTPEAAAFGQAERDAFMESALGGVRRWEDS